MYFHFLMGRIYSGKIIPDETLKDVVEVDAKNFIEQQTFLNKNQGEDIKFGSNCIFRNGNAIEYTEIANYFNIENLIFVYFQDGVFKKCQIIKDKVIHIEEYKIPNEWKEKDFNEFNKFIYDTALESNIINKVIAYVLYKHIDKAGFKTFSIHYWDMMRRLLLKDKSAEINHILYFINDDFWNLSELAVKAGVNSFGVLTQYHPLYTNQFDLSNLPKLNGICQKYIDMFDDVDLTVIDLMYKHPLIGPNGMTLIYNFCEKLKKINNEMSFNEVKLMYNVIDALNIKPQNLINYLIKSLFYREDGLSGLFGVSYYASSLNLKTLQILADTIEMAKELNYQIDKSILNNLEMLHDNYAVQITEMKDKKNSIEFTNQCQKNMELLDYVPYSDKYTVIAPQERADLDMEGRRMHNCVSSYFSNMVSGESKIFFIRNKDNINKSFVTIEFNSQNKAVQYFAAYNRRVNKETAEFIHEWERNIAYQIKGVDTNAN